MPRLHLLLLGLVLLSVPRPAHAQECGSGGGENPMGIAMGFAAFTAPLLALPVLATEGPLPRPGSGSLQVGLGYQSAPHSIVVGSDAGGYWGVTPWLGLEGRFASRAGCTGIDFHVDAAYLFLLRPTPIAWPLWVELLLGPSLEAAFGANTAAYITGGPSGGARVGFGIALLEDVRLILEVEGLYNARFGDSFGGVRHQLEAAARAGLYFDVEGAPESPPTPLGVVLEYRHERALAGEPTLPDTHRATIGLGARF